jgi:error-prone DNA polymerase
LASRAKRRGSCVQYAELHCLSNFTFLRGASHPEELVTRAAQLDYTALALTDECTLAGIVRGHLAAKGLQLKYIVGTECIVTEGIRVVVLAASRASYGALSALISHARRTTPKGRYVLDKAYLEHYLDATDSLILWLPDEQPSSTDGRWLKERFHGRLWLAAELFRNGRDRLLFGRWADIAKSLDLPMLASGDVHMHIRQRQRLQDALTAIRVGKPLDSLGTALYPNGERFLRPLPTLAQIYPASLLRETLIVAERTEFSLDELRYEYPRELVPDGETPTSHLRSLVRDGMRWRWPSGVPGHVDALLEHELALISELRYEPYFLTVHDIVRFARSRDILCQGRGSAANSAVCYCLGITEVDPARMDMLVERFISKERDEPPDIDVDFEHDRREEVIQYIYEKYSRERAALAATVVRYRVRSAMRDLGKTLGLDEARVAVLARSVRWSERLRIDADRVERTDIDTLSPKVQLLLDLATDLVGFPRHLSQHVGGFVISEGTLTQLVPIENAAMAERSVIQWDKDDLEALGLLKVDVLGLGMLSAIRRSFELMSSFYGKRMSMSDVPAEDRRVYGMICRADTMGVFQIESRAQMAMLPRLRPRSYYDLVIEVAIIRPGPIQGDMVHPYLRRRSGEEAVTYPSSEVEQVLKRTLGVPIFQEQVMKLAVVAAGFTPGEADRLRRAMAAWRRRGGLEHFEKKLIDGMRDRGYSGEFAQRIYKQIRGFGEYGFPESHAASFALLVYVSAWLKCHEPAVFCCALLNSQPMGFYAPAQLIRSAKEHGVAVRDVDVNASDWDSTLEADNCGTPAVRLGLRTIKRLSEVGARRLVAARIEGGHFDSAEIIAQRVSLDAGDLNALAASGALRAITSNRHHAVWSVTGVDKQAGLLQGARIAEAEPLLRTPTEGESIAADYRHKGLSLGRHPLALLRSKFAPMGMTTIQDIVDLAPGQMAYTTGLVITRQRPSSAAGVVFVTIEDETGYLNLIVWERVAVRQRAVLLGAALLGVRGVVQKEGQVLHVIAEELFDYGQWLGSLPVKSRDFH